MRWPYLLLTLAYCALIFGLSAQPGPKIPKRMFPESDKVAHAILYAGLTAVTAVGLRRSGPKTAQVRFYGPLFFTMFYGMTDEFHQLFVPLRTCEFLDWVADTGGALIALLTLFLVFWKEPIPGKR